MKKHVIFGALLCMGLCATSALPAQNIGVKGGINLASIANSAAEASFSDYKATAITGIQAGLIAELPILPIFAIQPELLWIQKGGRSTYSVLGSEVESRVRYNHIQIPVLAKVKATTEGSAFGLNFFGGPFASFSLNGKAETETRTPLGTVTNERKIEYGKDDSVERRIDWGLTFGLGASFGALFVDLRYDLGINNLLDDSVNTGGQNDKPYLRTRGIGLTAGLMLGR